MTWVKDKWICEDCGAEGEDWGAPETCPVCGSVNVVTKPKEDA